MTMYDPELKGEAAGEDDQPCMRARNVVISGTWLARYVRIELALRELLVWFDLDVWPGHAVAMRSSHVAGQWALSAPAHKALLAAYDALGETPRGEHAQRTVEQFAASPLADDE